MKKAHKGSLRHHPIVHALSKTTKRNYSDADFHFAVIFCGIGMGLLLLLIGF